MHIQRDLQHHLPHIEYTGDKQRSHSAPGRYPRGSSCEYLLRRGRLHLGGAAPDEGGAAVGAPPPGVDAVCVDRAVRVVRDAVIGADSVGIGGGERHLGAQPRAELRCNGFVRWTSIEP